ncbi:MAG: 1-deoxy-D-xylulose-5-phosphate reductoisomerase [Planctomycetota bacterium]|jgi:1-deoxy-D-xylulose-5-phosphate reductoisomerase
MTTPRRLIVLGSTGSIGTNVLAVVEHLNAAGDFPFEVVGLAAGTNAAALADQARRHGVGHVALADETRADPLAGLPHVHAGPDAARRLVESVARAGDLVVGAMVGAAGLPATLAAIDRGCDVALANKETLVAAGEVVMPRVRQAGVHLLPIDSEHSAIFQCLRAGRDLAEVRRLVMTASGGPFRTRPRARIEGATVDEALDHPTWSMGPKVTIDSASLMNKALELIEAHWLFGLEAERLEVIVHPQSIIHSFVEFVDGSVLAQLGPPDMRTPIQYALTWPRRGDGCARTMDWAGLRRLDFEPVDHDRFGAVRLAMDVIRAGGSSGAIFNAANEAAVEAFLAGRIPFGRITELVAATLAEVAPEPVGSLDDARRADAAARAAVRARLGESDSGSPLPLGEGRGGEGGLTTRTR